MKAVAINNTGDIVFELDVSDDVREVEVAGDVTTQGDPVNVRTFRISRSQANLKKAGTMDLERLSERKQNGRVFYVA